jgi:small subunit ribosomal protein S3e
MRYNLFVCLFVCLFIHSLHTHIILYVHFFFFIILFSHRACYGVVRFVMESEARGCEVIVSGKLRAARAKSMKFTDGYMVKSGQPKQTYVDCAVRHVKLRQGVLGVKVSIMLPHDPTGRNGPKEIQPDVVQVLEPKDEMGAVAKQ